MYAEASLNNKEAPCGSASLLRACRQVAKNLPVCPAIGTRFKRKEPIRNIHGVSTLVDLFEISDTLVERDLITLRNVSWSMFPVLMKGDILKVKPSKVRELEIGDIAVYRRFGRLYSHRVIDKKRAGEEVFIFTRADTSKRGNDGPVGDNDLLGKVTSIARRGKFLGPERRNFRLREKIYHSFIFLKIYIEGGLKSWTKSALKVLAKFKIFRSFLFILFSPLRCRMTFKLGLPVNSISALRFFNYRMVDDVSPDILEEMKKAQRWHMSVTCNDRLIGYAGVIHRPDDCPYKGYWIEDLFVRTRFRTAKIGTHIYRRLEHILGEIGVGKICVSVPIKNGAACRFFTSVGFTTGHVNEDRLKMFEKSLL